ncbi:hypothetical protein INR49_022974 [Caranx melampygus]|nr:hypothetical protein INR49_022974 [Caranx melampygus]
MTGLITNALSKMLTPAFDLSQDPDYLILSIHVPYTRTSEFDLYIDGTDFKFYAKPYFLRVPKETAGEHFEGLQMLTSLLTPKGSRSAQPLVEDLSKGCSESTGDDGEDEEEEFDWQVEQEVYTESSAEELRALQKYGFGNQRSGVFARLQEELSDVIDIKNPEATTAAERRQARLQAEASAFSPDHYLADLFEDDEVKGLLKFRPWWTKLSPSTEQEGEAAVSFTDDEKEQLRKFTNRSYLLDKASRQHAWLSLVDILLAYSYEVRSTEGEHNVESPWTIRKLSGTLCWLETYSSLQEVLVSFGRRVLCFPLYRHFALVSAAIRDATKIFLSGKACVLKCLLDIHKVFRENDPAYILNDLYLTDYCIWIQRVKSKKGGGGGGETSKDNPLQPQPTSTATPIPQEPTRAAFSAERKVDALPSASGGTRQLIQELGERVVEELKISCDSGYKAEGDCSQLSTSEAQTGATSGRSSSGTFLELNPRRNPLLIVQTQDDPDDSDFIS